MEKVVTKEIAISEVDSWLDFKKVGESKREHHKDAIDSLVAAMCEGALILNEDKVFVHTLKFPIGNEKDIVKLEYKPRVPVQTFHSHLQGTKSSDGDARVLAYIAAITSNPKELVKKLDTEDYSIAQSVAVFFL